MSEINFDGRVAIVTGAGGGLGRSHALALAERGAKVVVNDLGGARDGTGSGSEMADKVVTEITDAGGEAVANYDGVHTWEGSEAIVATAMDTWGQVDIVVNNAGILRDVTIHKMDQAQLDAVLKVHLYGAFHVTRAAWPHFREQAHGRVVNTSSGSGLYGNFGQSNYGAAKMGLVGLTRTLAHEGAKYNIMANAIAPAATSRMTEELFPDQVKDALGPEHVSPLVAWLCADEMTETGKVYSVGGGYIARVAIVEGNPVTFDHVATVDEVAAQFNQLADLGANPLEFTGGVNEQTTTIMQALYPDA